MPLSLKVISGWVKWIRMLQDSKVTTLALAKLQAIVANAREINVLQGITSNTRELNLLHGFTGSTVKLNRHVDPKVTVVNAATYTILETDSIIHVTYTTTGACTITWPSKLISAQFDCLILDAGGNAASNNITLATEGSETIDGDASWIINGDYDWILAYSSARVSSQEQLGEGAFATHALWDVTNDLVDSGGNATYTWSANQTSTLTQTSANQLIKSKGSQTYILAYDLTETVAFDGDGAITITTGFASASTTIPLTAGTGLTVEFTSASSPVDFVIQIVSGSDSQGTYVLDNLSLKLAEESNLFIRS